ncbi:MAG: hypothetical protein ACFBSE_16575, partial [Prochloraceae cyanobacterium]
MSIFISRSLTTIRYFRRLDTINENQATDTDDDPKPAQAVPKSKKRSQPRASKLQLNNDRQQRLQSLCNNLEIHGTLDRQFDQLLDWAEQKLTAQRSLDRQSNPTDNEQLLVKAIETIAKFSENFNNTLVPLTEELKLINQQKPPAPNNEELDRPQQTNGTTSKKIESIKETDIEPATTPVEDPIAPSILTEPVLDSQPTSTTDNNDRDLSSNRLSKLNPKDLASTIDALNLAISVKQSAI